MKRTNETLHILFGNVPFKTDSRLREMDFGAFEMHSYEELKNTFEYQAWLAGDNSLNLTPNGESGMQMKKRVLSAFCELKEEDTCIITHGGVISVIMQHLFPNENKTRYDWQPPNGHGYIIRNASYFRL